MAEPARIRKCYQLCRAVLKNAAYFRGGASLASPAKPRSQFGIVASNNFLDMVFLDWCKLFWDKTGKHHFTKVLPDPTAFMVRLLATLNMDGGAFDGLARAVAHYRDKEVAHADVYEVIDIPELDSIIRSAIQLYEALRSQCGGEPTPKAPFDLCATFRLEEDVGRSNFIALSKVQE